jgi:hypothetical protein
LLFRGFITKRRLDSGLVQVDERIIKIAYKSIIFSWNITFILVGLLLFLN